MHAFCTMVPPQYLYASHMNKRCVSVFRLTVAVLVAGAAAEAGELVLQRFVQLGRGQS